LIARHLADAIIEGRGNTAEVEKMKGDSNGSDK
jgi:hypothetical protein